MVLNYTFLPQHLYGSSISDGIIWRNFTDPRLLWLFGVGGSLRETALLSVRHSASGWLRGGR